MKESHKYFSLIVLGALLIVMLAAMLTYALWSPAAGSVISGFFRPYIEVANVGTAALSDKTLLLHDRITLAREIEQLRRRNTILEIQGGVAAALFEENRRLRRLIALAPLPRRKYVYTEILLRDPYSWRGIFSVNRGSDAGITPGDPVIECRIPGMKNLVGIIGKVERKRSEVIPLGNPKIQISARIGGEGGAVGFLNSGERTADAERVPIALLPQNCELQAGQAVITTGLERAIPPGLKIGEMESLDGNGGFFSGETQKSGFVKLTTNYNTLRSLIVITTPGMHP